jgi:hypothetical protein
MLKDEIKKKKEKKSKSTRVNISNMRPG